MVYNDAEDDSDLRETVWRKHMDQRHDRNAIRTADEIDDIDEAYCAKNNNNADDGEPVFSLKTGLILSTLAVLIDRRRGTLSAEYGGEAERRACMHA